MIRIFPYHTLYIFSLRLHGLYHPILSHHSFSGGCCPFLTLSSTPFTPSLALFFSARPLSLSLVVQSCLWRIPLCKYSSIFQNSNFQTRLEYNKFFLWPVPTAFAFCVSCAWGYLKLQRLTGREIECYSGRVRRKRANQDQCVERLLYFYASRLA